MKLTAPAWKIALDSLAKLVEVREISKGRFVWRAPAPYSWRRAGKPQLTAIMREMNNCYYSIGVIQLANVYSTRASAADVDAWRRVKDDEGK